MNRYPDRVSAELAQEEARQDAAEVQGEIDDANRREEIAYNLTDAEYVRNQLETYQAALAKPMADICSAVYDPSASGEELRAAAKKLHAALVEVIMDTAS